MPASGSSQRSAIACLAMFAARAAVGVQQPHPLACREQQQRVAEHVELELPLRPVARDGAAARVAGQGELLLVGHGLAVARVDRLEVRAVLEQPRGDEVERGLHQRRRLGRRVRETREALVADPGVAVVVVAFAADVLGEARRGRGHHPVALRGEAAQHRVRLLRVPGRDGAVHRRHPGAPGVLRRRPGHVRPERCVRQDGDPSSSTRSRCEPGPSSSMRRSTPSRSGSASGRPLSRQRSPSGSRPCHTPPSSRRTSRERCRP